MNSESLKPIIKRSTVALFVLAAACSSKPENPSTKATVIPETQATAPAQPETQAENCMYRDQEVSFGAATDLRRIPTTVGDAYISVKWSKRDEVRVITGILKTVKGQKITVDVRTNDTFDPGTGEGFHANSTAETTLAEVDVLPRDDSSLLVRQTFCMTDNSVQT